MSDPQRSEYPGEPVEEAAGIEVGPIPIDAVPGMARILVGSWVRGASWGIGTTVRAGRRLTEAALSGESAAQLIDEVREETVENLRRLIGELDGEPLADETQDGVDRVGDAERRRRADYLRERGAALFERASEISKDNDPIHPGFDRIVDQLAPDEARILKLLVNEGPQAIVYVNRAAPLGLGAREVARRLSLVGREAGCQRPGLVPAYLDNLVRLGLVAIRRDPVLDETAYQVLEAQPEVVEAMKSVNSGIFRGQSSRRSIHVTDFGLSFCQVCFPPEQLTGEFEALDPVDVSSPELLPPEPDLDGAEA